MDEQFDKNLADRVKEVFENYEDPLVNEGWLKLRGKFPEKRRRRPIAWWRIGAAAALLLFLGISLWINQQQVLPGKRVAKKISTSKTVPGDVKQQTGKDNNTGHGNHESTNAEKIAAIETEAKQAANSRNKASGLQKDNLMAKAVPSGSGNSNHQNTSLPKQTADSSFSLPAANEIRKERIARSQPKLTPVDSIAQNAQQPKKSINSMFAHDQQLSKSNTEKQKKDTRKVRFAVYAATYFNYAKGSDNQVNIGAGFTSDISLAKNLKLVTGVSIGQNSLSYSSPSTFNAAVPASASLLAGAASAYYSSFGNNVKTASPTLKNYDASLVGLDIPVNLKYSFNPKSDTYVLAGLSSGTFINETYTSQFNYPAQQTQNQVSHSSFNGFYFAKTLNLALGTGFNMGKNRVIVEPFLKYPLDGLGSQQLRFGAGGLNLKFNFQPAKK